MFAFDWRCAARGVCVRARAQGKTSMGAYFTLHETAIMEGRFSDANSYTWHVTGMTWAFMLSLSLANSLLVPAATEVFASRRSRAFAASRWLRMFTRTTRHPPRER